MSAPGPGLVAAGHMGTAGLWRALEGAEEGLIGGIVAVGGPPGAEPASREKLDCYEDGLDLGVRIMRIVLEKWLALRRERWPGIWLLLTWHTAPARRTGSHYTFSVVAKCGPSPPPAACCCRPVVPCMQRKQRSWFVSTL